MRAIIFFLLVSINAWAAEECELTDEYLSVKNEVAGLLYGKESDFNRCKDAARADAYWKALSVCVKNGDGKNIGGGCAHLVGYGKYLTAPDINHCEVFNFKPNEEMEERFLDDLVKARGIKKCRDT